MEHIGQRIRELRKARALTQKQLDELLGFSEELDHEKECCQK